MKIKSIILTTISLLLISCQNSNQKDKNLSELSYNKNNKNNPNIVKLAIIGDQGTGEHSRELLKLIKSQKADLLLINGDFDYENDPIKWRDMNEKILGKDFPIIAVTGNHDIPNWSEYQKIIKKWENNPKLNCHGDAGVRTVCNFRGIEIVSASPGIFENEPSSVDEKFIKESFKDSKSKWKICQWHKNMHDMQTGLKGDETGWGVYEECRENGAMIVTGHEHAYARSYLLSSIKDKEVSSYSDLMELKKGKSVVVLSGLGGISSRALQHDGYWWAAKENLDTGVKAGVLFCSYDLTQNLASCYFLDDKANIKDLFYIELSK